MTDFDDSEAVEVTVWFNKGNSARYFFNTYLEARMFLNDSKDKWFDFLIKSKDAL